MDEQPVNKHGQETGIIIIVRDGRVGRQNRGKGRRCQRHRHISDEIRAL